MGLPMRSNPALEPTAASGLRRLAVPSSLRSSAAAQRERSASRRGGRASRITNRYGSDGNVLGAGWEYHRLETLSVSPADGSDDPLLYQR
jgi:hypothetical protein